MSASIQKMQKVQFADLLEFMAVAECRSFTRAAADLGVSTATSVGPFGPWKSVWASACSIVRHGMSDLHPPANAFWKDCALFWKTWNSRWRNRTNIATDQPAIRGCVANYQLAIKNKISMRGH
jgi:hypothetical protein